jgi:hypothetical protein
MKGIKRTKEVKEKLSWNWAWKRPENSKAGYTPWLEWSPRITARCALLETLPRDAAARVCYL